MSNVALIANSPSLEILGDLRKPGPWVCLSKSSRLLGKELNRTPLPLREPAGTGVTSRGRCGRQKYWLKERNDYDYKINDNDFILGFIIFVIWSCLYQDS